MQDRWRESGQTSQAAWLIEIGDDRHDTGRAQFVGAFRPARHADDAGLTAKRLQLPRAAQADIAAADDQHTRATQNSSGIHVRAL